MRTLDAIVAATRSAEPVTEEELRYAVVAFDVLLYSLDLPADYKRLQQWFVAAEADPQKYIGKDNDPADEEAATWYRIMHNAGNEPVLEAPKVRGRAVEAWGFVGGLAAGHVWDKSGERCTLCGDKDCFARPHCPGR